MVHPPVPERLVAMTRYPPIAPVPDGVLRPFWSVMIPTYNPDPGYLAQALAAVLDQDPGPATMEIVVIDDASDVDPARSLARAERDRVSWLRQPGHVGIGENWNACIRRARGAWVHILHQDDLVRPGFYASLREGMEAAPAVGAALCRDVVIDAQGRRSGSQWSIRETAGIVDDWIEHVFVGLHLRASAVVVKRSTYEALGGFAIDMRYALDWDMWKRIAATHPLWYEPRELACYRRHPECASAGFLRAGGAHIAEIRRSIERSASLLPPAVAADVTARARTVYTDYAVHSAWQALGEGHLRSALSQLREARRLTGSLAVAVALGRRLARKRRAAHRGPGRPREGTRRPAALPPVSSPPAEAGSTPPRAASRTS
jgi:Glycosyl transferase family 2